jgi:putative membrane protein
VTEDGTEPDPRFSLANERTFLAWVRTALALIVAGGAIAQFAVSVTPVVRGAISILLIGLGACVAVAGHGRWRRADRALRLGQALPAGAGFKYLAFGLGGVGALLVGALLMGLVLA